MTATRARPEAPAATGPAYAAFISYSRAVDGRLAPKLADSLERFAKPWYRLRALRVFRDDDSLSTSPGLWSSLTAALDRTSFFVLLASPGSAASEWVGREVAYWLEHRDRDRLLIVLTDGEIGWDEHTGDFDWQRTTALPRELAGVYHEEPRYTDLRFAAASEHLSLRDPRFRAVVADVAAPLHGRAKDDLIGEEVRQHRRTLRIARAAGAALALLAVAATVAAVLAVRSADRANRERDRAEREARVATSRQLAAQSSVAVRDGAIQGALAQAGRAWRTARTTEARGALLAALKAAPGLVGTFEGPPAQLAAVSGDRGRVALLGADRRLTVLDLATGRPVGEPLAVRPPTEAAYPVGVALDRRGTALAVGYDDGRLDLWDLAQGEVRALDGPAPVRQFVATATRPAFAADGSVLAWAGPHHGVSVWDGRRVRRLRAPVRAGEAIRDVAVSADGRYVAMAGTDGFEVVRWRLDRPRAPRVLPARAPTRSVTGTGQHGAIALGAGPHPLLAVGGVDDGRVDLWDAAGERRTIRAARGGAIDSIAFSPDGRRFTVVAPGGLTLWTADGSRLARYPSDGAERGAAPLDDGGRVAAVGASGAVTVRDGDGSRLARRLEGADANVGNLAFDRSGQHVLASDRRTRLRSWPVSGGPPGPPLTPPIDPSETAWLPDGRVATCCGSTRRDIPVRTWGPEDRGRRVDEDVGEPWDLAVTTAGRLVVAGYRRETLVVSDGRRRLDVPVGDYGGRLSDDGRWASVGTDQGLDVWSVEQRRKLSSVPGDDAVFAPDGRLLATSAFEGPIRLFDLSGRARGALGASLMVELMAFSPDGRTLATIAYHQRAAGATDTRLELWDVTDPGRAPEVLLDIGEETTGNTGLAFSPDGRKLAVAGLTADPLVFDVDPGAWAGTACRLSGC